MGKAVLLSIRPTWANEIDRGTKTVEVRKSLPTIEGYPFKPFKVYLYCTQGKDRLVDIIHDGDDIYGDTYHGKPVFITYPECGYGYRVERKTVFGEFLCDKSEMLNNLFSWDDTECGYHLPHNGESCLTKKDLEEYGKGKRLWGWHVSNYKYYKEPKSLADFGLTRPPQSWCYVEELE